MPSELQRVASGLLACIDRIPDMTGYLMRTAARCREQAAYLAAFGSSNPAANTAALQLDAAARACEQAAEYAGRVPPRARGWVEEMVSGARAAAPRASRGPTPNTSPQTPEGTTVQPEPSDDDIAGVMRRLPQRGQNGPTTGLFVNEDGETEEFVSGRGELQKKALDLCRAKGWPAYDRIKHTEIKFAMHMRDRGLKHARLYLNNTPCSKKLFNCVTLLPQFLPPSAKLVIYGPDGYKKTFEGESEGGPK